MRSGPRSPLPGHRSGSARSGAVALVLTLVLAVTGASATPVGADDISDQEARVAHIADQLEQLTGPQRHPRALGRTIPDAMAYRLALIDAARGWLETVTVTVSTIDLSSEAYAAFSARLADAEVMS